MQGAEMRRGGYSSGTRTMKDVETWLANSLATILAGLAIAAGVIGLLVGLNRMGSATNPFQDGVIWLAAGIILGLCANVFRREHHVVDNTELMNNGGTYREPEGRRMSYREDQPERGRATYREVEEPERGYREERYQEDRPQRPDR